MATHAVCASPLTGKVVGVSDGDTIKILDASKTQHIIRLAGIDAPEKAQPFGQRSKENLSRLVFGKQVTIHGDKIDKYRRRVGKVMGGSTDANLEQVKAGMAWHYKAYENEQSPEDRSSYAAAEVSGRSERAGLWRDPAPMAPWEWRRGGEVPVNSSSRCPCSSEARCTGERGGKYCNAPNGKKRYGQ